MPRQVAAAIENTFIKGLITEATPLKFPTDACTDALNCIFDNTGRITRRDPFLLEETQLQEGIAKTISGDEVYTEYLWRTVAGNGNSSFFVLQKGSKIHFYDVSNSINFSNDRKTFEVDLLSFIIAGSSLSPATNVCQYASGNGNLIIVNRACNPILVVYNPSSDTITSTPVVLKFRDFIGVEDGLALTERPGFADVATLKTNNPNHYYNILNQGWYVGDALDQWDTARADIPSNADIVSLYRKDSTDAFDPTHVTAQSGANTPAPKGHFILKVGAVDRTAALVAEGFTGATVGSGSTSIVSGSILNINSAWLNSDKAFDGDTTQTTSFCAFVSSPVQNQQYGLGKTLVSPARITKAIVYGTTNTGFASDAPVSNFTIRLYGKQTTAPTTPTNGTLLGTITFSGTFDESAGRTVNSSDAVTFWDHVWITIATDFTPESFIDLAEIQLFTVATTTVEQVTMERPSAVAFFAQRAWYAGINDVGLNSNIYFSQVIQKDDQYAKCYQENDPSSEFFFDLLPTDGGFVRIPEIGRVIKLFPYQSSIIVIASNGVWMISGSLDKGFSADDFSVRKLSSVGTSSSLSVVEVKGVPIWWAEDGIYTVSFKADYNSFEVNSVITNTIQSFFDAVPIETRDFVKGAYDILDFKVHWVFSDSTPGYVYNSVLVLDTVTGAFYPWTAPTTRFQIVGNCYVQDASRQSGGVIKYTLVTSIDDAITGVTFGSYRASTSYLDWDTDDYESFFITGYRVDGQAQRNFQSNYVWLYLDTLANSSCLMQGLWDWTSSGDSGKWSSAQQIYNQDDLFRAVTVRRLKIRGKGKALQLKFTAETGKPFSLLGWSIYESSNASP